MPVTYATVEDLDARWRELDDDEQARATVALTDASVQLRLDIPDLATRLAAAVATAPDGEDSDLAYAARQVVCAMVRRAMGVTGDGFGVTTTQETQGPFSRSFNYANPLGDLYTTKAERRRLGSGGQVAYSIDTAPEQLPSWAESWTAGGSVS